MKIVVDGYMTSSGLSVSTQCPACSHKSVFIPVLNDAAIQTLNANDQYEVQFKVGMRFCPNEKCKQLLFFVRDEKLGELVDTFPRATIPFDTVSIPENIVTAFEEALICFANKCYIASAIMIRKTLEEICSQQEIVDEKGLYNKLQKLSDKITIPNELKAAMQEIRLLGNDAAHIESKTFQSIGKEELEISIDFTKEILKALYQYQSLLEKLKGLKKRKEEFGPEK